MSADRPIDLMVARNDDTLRARVQARLRDAILDGDLAPGQKLIERELTEMTGVSRSILREALVHLEARGLIERVAYKGFAVARVSADKVRDIYELRATLEAMTAELFARRATETDLSELAGAGEALLRALRGGEVPEIRRATTRYYDLLFDGCGNTEVCRALENVSDRVLHLRGQSMASPDRRKASAAEMKALTEALLRRDATAAAAASRRHVEAARDAVLVRLNSIGPAATRFAAGKQ